MSSAPVLWRGERPFPALAERSCGFRRGKRGGKQVVPVLDSTEVSAGAAFPFSAHPGASVSLPKLNQDKVLAEESWTQRRDQILNSDDKAQNKNQQHSDNLSTFHNLRSRMAGNGI